MRRFIRFGLVLATASLVFAGGLAFAQPLPPAPSRTTYDVKTINFDLWCQETQKLPPDRCDKRLPQDDAAYQAYVNTVERYEIPYLQRRQQEQNFNRIIMHSDPTANPVDHPQQPPAPNP